MMEQKITLLFIKISTFILLIWICHFYNDTSPFNKSLDEKCNIHLILNTENYRLLGEYKRNKDSCLAYINEEIPNNVVRKKKYISKNKKGTKGKRKQLFRSSLYMEELGKTVKKNKCVIPKTKKYFDFEKKIFKKLDYKDYIKNINPFENKEYKKLERKKRRIRIALLLLFFLVLIVPVLDISLETYTGGGLLGLLSLVYPKTITGGQSDQIEGILATFLSTDGWSSIEIIFRSPILIYCVPFLIFVVVFILGMVYYYNKVIKYENIKFIKRLNKR
ncbi:fam-l protein [Plasmodium malariae]|uniref:Fam-l protein n=1 Tax=Plasmodium malariae TaxID=5858 RepID=A0A1D3RHB2_PLAMA|nr:fam-l protein [Plasmodium malariae]SCN44529.1 fam-l protein [Plasmodium malariae]